MAELTEEEIQTLKEIAQERKDKSISRRDFGKLGVAGGLGALLGGGGASQMIGKASAAGPNDSVPDIGDPNDPVDVYADLADANTVNTDDADISATLTIPEVTSDPAEGNLWIRSDL